MVTIQDIANKIGLNKSTVSKALNNSGDLNPETVKKVRRVACEIGFVSNRKHTGKNLTIGIVYPEMDDAVYTQIVNTLTSEIEGEGYNCLAIPYNFDNERMSKAFSYLIEKKVDGIFLFDIESDVTREEMRIEATLSGTVVVGISMKSNDPKFDNLWINEKVGVSDAVKCLAEYGHKKIAYIGDRYGKIRYKYFEEAMKENNISINNNLVCITHTRNFECGYEEVQKIIKKGEKFTALFCQYDAIAVGAMRALSENGIKIPEDCSIVGVDDASYSKFLVPSLSSVNSNVSQLCSIAFRIMDDKLKDSSSSTQSVLINPTFIVRESIGRANER